MFSQSQISVPNVYVNIIPPNPLISGIPANIMAVVGTAQWGPKNSQVVFGNMQEGIQIFGSPQPRLYDLLSPVYAASQQGANNFIGVRVTDGTDVAASANLLDITSATGVTLTSLYTGSLPNSGVGNLTALLGAGSGSTSANITYRLTISFANGIPEIFDGIPAGSTATQTWSNIANAVNFGQGALRGPSQIVSAATTNSITSVTVSAGGSYATLPVVGTNGPGSGASFVAKMAALSGVPVDPGAGYLVADTITLTGGTETTNTILTVATLQLASAAINAGGSGYNVGDQVTLSGGTDTVPAVVTVLTVTSGAIATFSITNGGVYTVGSATLTQASTTGSGTGATFNSGVFGVGTVTVSTAGLYTVLPTNPVAQGTTTGSGTDATFNILWKLSAVTASGGSGYNSSTTVSITGGGSTGGALASLVLASASTPVSPASYSFSGGLDGATGVNSATLVGVDGNTRTGMYALRGSLASVVVLADAYDPAQWSNQVAFAQQEYTFVVGTVAPNFQDNISGAVGQKITAGINSYNFKLMTGDWCLISDPYNNVSRYISPQGFTAGEIVVQSPDGSALNKVLNSIVATQKTAEQRIYSNADLLQLEIGGLDVITNPIPAGNSFGVRIGINTSSNSLQRFDNYTRMVNFLSVSFLQSLGAFIGLPQTVDTRLQAQSALATFLQTLQQLGMIGNVNGGAAFSVILDATNNPLPQVALGFMQANVQVTLFSIIQQFVINLQAGQNIQVTTLPPQLA